MWSSRPRAERLFKSLTLRLALIFGFLGFLVIGGVVLYTYSSVRHAIHTQVDKEVAVTARVLLHRLEDDAEAPNKEMLDVGEHLSVRILDPAGEVLIATPFMDRRVPTGAFPSAPKEWVWEDEPQGGAPFRLLTLPYQKGYLQLARDTSAEVWLMQRLRTALLWAFGLAPVLTALAGYGLVRVGLRPIDEVAGILERVRPETLTTRIKGEALPTELLPLAGAINRALERLQSSFARLSELNGDLAHELRTPIHCIRLEVEQILSKGNLSEAGEETHAGIMESLEHLSLVIEQMLFLSRFEDPSQGLERKDLEAKDLLRSAVAPFESFSEESKVHLHWEAEAGLSLRGDGVLLRRALHNLLANAVRHAPPGTNVHLRARAEGAEVVLEVEDEGAGMPAELIAKIGRRFLRSDASRSAQTGGSGLGLAIVQGIARAHGGRLEVGSFPGQGCVIQVKLPRT
ncbi:MAG: hypothetical protein HYZ13_06615 [Acidobacteria bacterium]|nr:hypothetical protein [Acidobacteriota bacterium]